MSEENPGPEILELLARVSTNTIAGELIQLGGMRSRAIAGVRPINPSRCRFVGPAFTVRCVPIREDLGRNASMANPGNPFYGTFDNIPAGSVVVYDMRGETRCGALGDVLVSVMKANGVAGIVADGGMRDGEAIAEIGLPVFCAAIAPPPIGQALYTAGIQETIGCGGVMVVPGDIAVGDADGVVIIPRALAAEIARRGSEKEEIEAWIRSQTDAGTPARGLYPPDAKVIEEFHRWRQANMR